MDGANQSKVPISVPAGLYIEHASILPDGQTLTLNMATLTTEVLHSIYKWNINGTGLTKIIDNTASKYKFSALSVY